MLLFADDQVVMEADEDDINYTMRKLTETYEKLGLKINSDKTKHLVTDSTAPLNIYTKTVHPCSEY